MKAFAELKREHRLALVVESFCVLAVLASAGWCVDQYRHQGYLPAPFLYAPYDTTMDWFNVAFWAHHRGAYEVWQAVYPPISFVFLRIFGLPGCYRDSSIYARDCDWIGMVTLVSIYIVDVVIAARIFYMNDKSTALLRSTAFMFGLPMLYGFERGNLILLCFTFFMIAYFPITQHRLWRWVSAAVTLNFKPYLLLPLLALPIKRDWRGFEIVGFLAIGIYCITWAMLGTGSPLEVLHDMTAWSSATNSRPYESIYYSTTYAPMLDVSLFHLPLLRFLPSKTIEFILNTVPVAIGSSQIVALLALAGAWLHPNALPRHRSASLLYAVGIVSQNWGGYTQIFLVFLVFLEPWRRPGPIVALLSAYALSLSYEHLIFSIPSGGSYNYGNMSWLAQRTVDHQFGVGLGQLARPGFVIIILWALALDTIYLTVGAHRREPAMWSLHRKAPFVAITPA